MITRKLIRSVLLLAAGAGLAMAWTTFAPGHRDGPETVGVSASAPQVWTCSMHPQIRMDHKDRCPLCGMDLTPVKSNGSGGGDGPADPLSLSPYAQMMARVATTPVRAGVVQRHPHRGPGGTGRDPHGPHCEPRGGPR